jgi:hypothetical protein
LYAVDKPLLNLQPFFFNMPFIEFLSQNIMNLPYVWTFPKLSSLMFEIWGSYSSEDERVLVGCDPMWTYR